MLEGINEVTEAEVRDVLVALGMLTDRWWLILFCFSGVPSPQLER